MNSEQLERRMVIQGHGGKESKIQTKESGNIKITYIPVTHPSHYHHCRHL